MAGQEVQGMLIRLEATTAQLRQEMSKADATVAQVSGRIDSQLGRVDGAFDRVGQSAQAAGNMLKGAVGAYLGSAGISELLKHAEAYTTIANRLKLVTTGAAEFTAAQNAVFAIAQRSGQPLEATAELYQRIAQNQNELKLSGKGVAGIVETISKTMVISGASTESANAALIQLGQAFASGTLRGEELNSVLEQAPALAQAIAKGMGVSVGALRALGATGKLTADAVVKALQAQAGAVDQLFGKMQITVSQGMTKLDNSATNLIGKLDQTSGVSQKLSGVLTDMSKVLDSVANDGTTLSTTVQRVTNVVETLAVVIGARLAISLGQSALAFASATKASIEQAAALARSTAAADAALIADAATAKQALLTAESRQVDAKAMLERANVELATAEQKVAADRMRQASELGNLQSVQAALVAERGLEEQRLKAQITETGRAQSVARLAELRLSEVAIIDQVKAAEVSLGETTVATSAQIQAAYKARAAAAGAYAETTLAANSAAAVSERTAAAASVASRSVGVLSAAGGGLLSLMTGPVGLIATAALVAASFIDFGGSAEKASKALIDHGLTIDQTTQKYKDLSAEQQRFQSATWVKEQKDSLNSAASDLADYSTRVMTSLNAINRGSTEYQQQFVKMVAEVKAGTRSLDSVTAWAKETVKLAPTQVARLTEIASAYSQSTKDAADFGKKLSAVDAATKSAATSTDRLSASQQNSGMTDANKVAWDKYIEQLTKTRDLLGANAEAEAAYNAAKMGASPTQVAAAKLIGEQTDTLKKYQEAIKQNNEVEKAALKIKLASLYAAEDAQNAAVEAQKKTLEDAAKATEESATRQVNAMQRIINQTVRVATGTDMPRQNLSGYGLLTNGGTAPVVPAAPVVPKATPIQRADAATAQLDATTEANKRVDKAANAAAAALRAQEKALTDLLAKSVISTKSANDMADAYLGGADNVRAMTIQQKIEEDLLKTGAGARDQVTKAINDMQDAEDRRDVAKTAAAMKVEVDQTLAQAKATLQGSDALEIYNVNKSMQIELAGKNIQYGSKEYDQLLKQTKAQLEANKALEAANKANDLVDRLNPQIKLLREYTEDQKALNAAIAMYPEHADLYRQSLVKLGQEYGDNQAKLTVWGRLTEGALDRIDKSFADAWLNIDKGFKGFSDGLMDGFKQLLAELAHEAITKPIMISFANTLLGTNKAGGVGDVISALSGDSSSGSSSGIAGVANKLYSAYNIVTGVGAKVVAGYAEGGVTGAAKAGVNYYGDKLSALYDIAKSGVATLLGQQTALQIAQQAATQAALNYGITEGVASTVGQFTLDAAGQQIAAGMVQQAATQGVAQAAGAQGASSGATSALGSAASMWPLAVIMGMIQSGKLYSAGVRPDASAMNDSAGGTGLGKVVMSIPTLTAKAFELVDGALSKIVGGKAAAILTGSTLYQAVWSKVGTKLFGTGYQTKDAGIQLAVKSGEFDAEQYTKQKKKGGLISGSSKTRYLYNELPDDTEDALGGQYNATVLGATALFTQLGVKLNDSVLDGLNMASAQISTQNKTSEQIQAEVDHWFALLGDQVVVAVSQATDAGVSGFSYVGLQAFVKNLYDVNSMLKHVNVGLYDMSVTGGFMAEQLSAMGGGFEELQKSVSGYYDAFFSDNQKSIDTINDIQDVFDGLNVKLPDSRDGFRAMVEGIDKSTEAGRKMFVTLMTLADAADQAYDIMEARQKTYYGAFYSESENTARTVADVTAEFKKANVTLPASREGFRAMVDGIDRTTESGKTLYNTMTALAGSADTFYKAQEQVLAAAKAASMTAVSDAFSALQRAVDAEKNALTDAYNRQVTSLNDMLATVQQNVSNLTTVGNSLDGALKALRGTSDSTVRMLRSQAQATLASALSLVQAGGSLAGFEGLTDALSMISDNNTDLYGSLEDFNRDQGRTANVVAQLNAINGTQLTTQQRTLKAVQDQLAAAKLAYDAQVKALDQDLADAQAQIDKLNGINTSVISVKDAINNLNSAILAAISANGATKPAAPATGGGGAPAYGGTGTAGAPSGNDLNSTYQAILGRDASYNDMIYWAGVAGQNNYTQQQLADAIRNDALKNGELKSYATGGLIGGPGSGTSDSILARVSNGEFVMSAAAVRAYGPDLLDQMNNLEIPAFAAGGPVLSLPTIDEPDEPVSFSRASSGDDRTAAVELKLDKLIDVMKQLMGPVKVDTNKSRKLFEKWDTEGLPAGSTA